MKFICIYLGIALALLSSCATANRSARGIRPGMVNISYIPPFSGALRVGLSKNVEGRISLWYSRPVIDLFIHSAQPGHLFNYGLACGVGPKTFWSNDPDFTPFYFASLTVGPAIKNRFYPYVTFSYYRDFKLHNSPKSWDLAAGCETILYKYKNSGNELILTPEIIIAPYFDDYPFNTSLMGTIGLGFSFNLNKL